MFLLDDHEMVRRGLKDLLDSHNDIEIVGESGSAKDAEARIPALRPDVALLDGRLADGSGVEVCRSIRSVDPSINAIILTSYDDDEALFAAIRMAGASATSSSRSAALIWLMWSAKGRRASRSVDPSVTQRVLERIRSGGSSELDASSR